VDPGHAAQPFWLYFSITMSVMSSASRE
jgi:hypothetical protein